MDISADISAKQAFWLAAAVLAGVVLLRRNAAAVGSAVVGAAADVGAGVVIGIGDVVGLPRTDQTECEKALAEGRYWDASFVCPAGDFITGVFSGEPAGASPTGGGASGTW